MTRRPGTSPARYLIVLGAGVLGAGGLATGCSSSSTHRTTAGGAGSGPVSSISASSPSTQPAAAPTTVAGQMPTVYDCGGGAYKPATLLVVCGVGSATATGVHWASWSASSASATGTVNLPGKSPAPASLLLSDVVSTGNGPQFSRLQVTWTGSSPDGRSQDVFTLATAPSQG